MSPLLAPDLPEIERTLDVLMGRNKEARLLAMRSPIRRNWPEAVERDGRRFRIAWCPSELDLREQLDQWEDSDEGVVLLTPLDATVLGDDVVARFPRGRLEETDRWSALRHLFGARAVDSRLHLPENRWLVDLLLDRPPARGYVPVAAGFLDLENAWRAALDELLGVPAGRTDASSLLDWSLNPAAVDRLARLPDDARKAIAVRLGAEGGPAAELIVAAAAAGRGTDLVPVALACGVVFGEKEQRPALREAAIRMEPMFGGMRIAPDAGRALAEAGRRILDRLAREGSADTQAIEARTTAVLAEIRADDAAALSPALPIGLEARMAETAAAIKRAVETGHVDDADDTWILARHANAHDRAWENRPRLDRLLMAARLVRWLTNRNGTTWRNISEAASAHAAEGGFVDRARHAIRAGDALPDLGAAYASLAKAAAARRERENHAFAELLMEWTLRGAQGDDPLPVENVLSHVVAPLARATSVLLLVFDGLSFAVWRGLAETVGRLGWKELVSQSRRGVMVAAAALPTVTEVSRTSLLCGELTRGDQGTERAGFASHRGLVAASRTGKPPRLFHKADLGAGPELSAEVREAVVDRDQRVVGIVHNAVDAQLSGSDQLDLTWTAENLRQVAALLQAARDAGRTVVVTGDHGHMLDEATVLMPGGSGDRWRRPETPPQEGEISLKGGRVLSPAGGKAIVAAWSEKIRFAGKRGGYHGGASPQEVLVPVAVLTAGEAPGGWSEAPPAEPSWWRGSTEEAIAWRGIAPIAPPTQKRRRTEHRQPELLLGETGPVTATPPSRPAWVDALFVADDYAAQRRLAGRAAPTDEVLSSLLQALSARGGRMTRTGLAQALGVAELRIRGLVSAARRVLNLDQAQVLRDDGDDIVLDDALLRAQFKIGGDR